jgi:hypothetical protein
MLRKRHSRNTGLLKVLNLFDDAISKAFRAGLPAQLKHPGVAGTNPSEGAVSIPSFQEPESKGAIPSYP